MRILLTKISNEHHALEIIRDDGSRERVELVTREFMFHDLLHYAVESAIGTQEGFWGALASGKTMAQMNDRSGEGMSEYSGPMVQIEQAVGTMTGAIKGDAPSEHVMEMILVYFASLRQEPPSWFTLPFVADVKKRMLALQGHWNGTAFGDIMEIPWSRR